MNDLATVISGGAKAALEQVADNPTRDGATAALENFATDVVQSAASAAGPIAGLAAKVAAPLVMHQIAVALVQLFAHVGAAIPHELEKAVAALEKVIHVDLDGDGTIGA